MLALLLPSPSLHLEQPGDAEHDHGHDDAHDDDHVEDHDLLAVLHAQVVDFIVEHVRILNEVKIGLKLVNNFF